MPVFDCALGRELTPEEEAALPPETPIVLSEAELRALIPPITRRQAKLALLGADLLSNVDTALAALPSPQKEAAQIEWGDASIFERNHPLIATMTQALGLTEAEVDDLFRAAAAL